VMCCAVLCCGRPLFHDPCPVGVCRNGDGIDEVYYFVLTERYKGISWLGVLNTRHLKTIINARMSE
jgi:hypothetical protein